jgi:HEAT repeat protein
LSVLPLSFDGWCDARVVDALGSVARASVAYRELVRRGHGAIAAIVAGLQHESPAVRLHCCELLDTLLVPEAEQDLLAMLADSDAAVRAAALHAVACDKCKQHCRLQAQSVVLSEGTRLLDADPAPGVRAQAIGVVGRFVHTSEEATAAIVRACQRDPSPAVRKKARLYMPGGTIYRKTTPKMARR